MPMTPALATHVSCLVPHPTWLGRFTMREGPSGSIVARRRLRRARSRGAIGASSKARGSNACIQRRDCLARSRQRRRALSSDGGARQRAYGPARRRWSAPASTLAVGIDTGQP